MAKKTKTKKKITKPVIEEKKEVFFVGVKDPIELRRSILEGSKNVVMLLQKIEKIKKLRTEKIQNSEYLGKVMKQIGNSLKKLRTTLPKTNLKIDINQKIIPKQTTKKVEIKKNPKISELDELEKEIERIEQKLHGL